MGVDGADAGLEGGLFWSGSVNRLLKGLRRLLRRRGGDMRSVSEACRWTADVD